jgi:hypothetical protein
MQLDQRHMVVPGPSPEPERNLSDMRIMLNEEIPVAGNNHAPGLNDPFNVRPSGGWDIQIPRALAEDPDDHKTQLIQQAHVFKCSRHSPCDIFVGPQHREKIDRLGHKG